MQLDPATVQKADAKQKADQIAHRFFAKFALVVENARNLSIPPSTKVDKWVSRATRPSLSRDLLTRPLAQFNLETPDSDTYKDHLRVYRALSTLDGPPPPLELQVLLTVPELTNNQVLVQHDPAPHASRVRVDPAPTHILLESWALAFVPLPPPPSSTSSSSGASTSSSSADSPLEGPGAQARPGAAADVTPATVYKHAIAVFRSLYTLLRVLPAWRLVKRLQRRAGGAGRNGQLGIALRVAGEHAPPAVDLRVLGFGESA